MNHFLKISFVIFLLSLTTSIFAHDAFVSVTTIRYDSVSNQLQIEMKLTGHDLEKAISEAYGPPFNLDKGSTESNIETLSKYLSSSFKVKMNDAKRTIKVLGYEIGTDDDLWIFLVVDCPKNVISFNLTNKVLTEVFGLQQNMIHFKDSQDNLQTFVFTKYKHTQKINWK